MGIVEEVLRVRNHVIQAATPDGKRLPTTDIFKSGRFHLLLFHQNIINVAAMYHLAFARLWLRSDAFSNHFLSADYFWRIALTLDGKFLTHNWGSSTTHFPEPDVLARLTTRLGSDLSHSWPNCCVVCLCSRHLPRRNLASG